MEENKNEMLEGVDDAPSTQNTDTVQSASATENDAPAEITEEAVAEPQDTADAREPAGVTETEATPRLAAKPIWNFTTQVAEDRAELKKRGRRGALVYAIIMTALFAICFATLAVLLISGYGANNGGTYPPTDYLPNADGVSLSALYEELNPSVVSVSCTLENGSSIGSGFIYTESGYIITNYHVIDGAVDVVVYLSDGSDYKAEIVGSDEISDIAVLHINAKWLKPAVMGDSDALVVGQSVVAIGTPISLEFSGTFTDGIISGLNRYIEIYNEDDLVEKSMNMIQTNTILNPGNSGGPLFTLAGEVIGINNMKYIGDENSGTPFEGVGFAIPINAAIVVADEIIETGSYSGSGDVAEKGVNLGIACGTVVEGQSVTLGNQSFTAGATGVLVSEVKTGYPAEGKLKVRDIITHIDGEATETFEALKEILVTHKSGDTIELTVFRDNSSQKVTITL